MSFLDKIRSTQANDNSENPLKSNPLLNSKKADTDTQKKENPLLKALAAKKNEEKKVEPETSEINKKNPFVKPEDKSEKKTDSKEKLEATRDLKVNGETVVKKGEKVDVEKESDSKENQSKKDVQNKEEKKDVQAVAEESKKEEQSKEVKKEIKEKPKETKKNKEEKPKENKKNKDVKKDKDKTDTTSAEELDFKEIKNLVFDNYIDPEWDKYTEEIKEDLSKIIIESDMTSSQLKVVMADLTKLRDKVWLEYLDYKTQFEILAGDKPEGKIERIKKTAFTQSDKNDFDRKKAGILACMNHEVEQDGKKVTINLFEICDEYRKRFNFLNEVLKSISFKADALIKMSTGIKLENSIN